ncbi:hypothetical protein CROQUDRAFT_102061 [Cronartium quercuum f. sp. fusiforme G11]|uniref:Uncharacterized protein n=1 Tax=Cronartium quercuum f. sp. fusiforme G11 TaxID=708437 RepID=A0A9P6T561_9BASI|nr:hypothetical protein CROQUDRAFT_102061 [Cronartium quercuum f. sp. fusiforme G11]
MVRPIIAVIAANSCKSNVVTIPSSSLELESDGVESLVFGDGSDKSDPALSDASSSDDEPIGSPKPAPAPTMTSEIDEYLARFALVPTTLEDEFYRWLHLNPPPAKVHVARSQLKPWAKAFIPWFRRFYGALPTQIPPECQRPFICPSTPSLPPTTRAEWVQCFGEPQPATLMPPAPSTSNIVPGPSDSTSKPPLVSVDGLSDSDRILLDKMALEGETLIVPVADNLTEDERSLWLLCTRYWKFVNTRFGRPPEAPLHGHKALQNHF